MIDVVMSPSGGSWSRYGSAMSKSPLPSKSSLTGCDTSRRDAAAAARRAVHGRRRDRRCRGVPTEVRGALGLAEHDRALELDGRGHDIDAATDGEARDLLVEVQAERRRDEVRAQRLVLDHVGLLS